MTETQEETRLAEELANATDRLVAGESAEPLRGEAAGLVETAARLRAAVASEPPSPAFAARLRERALSELPAARPTAGERLQDLVARLLGEEDFRRSFFAAPEATLQRAGIRLSAAEMAALRSMEPEDLEEWASDLDERVSKAGLTGA
jgi:hypothetical protein